MQEAALDDYRRAASYFWPDRIQILVLIALIGVSVCISVLEAWPLSILIDTVLANKAGSGRIEQAVFALLPESPAGKIAGLVFIGAALQITGYVVWLARMLISARLKYQGTTRVRLALFGKLQRLGLAYHRLHAQGDALYRLGEDVAGPWGVVELAIGTGVATVTLTVMTAILLSCSATLTCAAFGVAPLLIASNLYFARKIHHASMASKQADATLTGVVQQSLATVALAQAFGRERHELGRFRATVQASNEAAFQLTRQEQLYPLARDAIIAISAAVIFGYGGYLVYRDQVLAPVAGGMTVGALLIFIDYTRKLWEPMKWVMEFVAKVQFHRAASQRVFEVLDRPETPEQRPEAVSLPTQPRRLIIDRVGFGFGAGQPILHDISAEIRPGEMVAFVGPSGTGKSTLLNLMMRFYDPTSGALRLDDVDFRDASVADLRRHMALVSQDNPILPLSVAENIAYGRPDAMRPEIVAAAQMADVDEFVADLPAGYDTVLSEGGQNLSGGQRQRLAIARALLSQAPFLILDEPTSALDPEHERRLNATLRRLRGQRTIILVTHRLESVVACDQIFVMDGGRILEQGRHADLLTGGTRYAQGWASAHGRHPADARGGVPSPKVRARQDEGSAFDLLNSEPAAIRQASQ